MKRTTVKKAAVIGCLILFAAAVCVSFVPVKKLAYYAKRESYAGGGGVLTYIKEDEETGTLYLAFEGTDAPYGENDTFKLIPENYRIAKEAGLKEKLLPGAEATFVSAPRCFGDGYVLPIVSITVDGVAYLSFEEGYGNLNQWLRNCRNLI